MRDVYYTRGELFSQRHPRIAALVGIPLWCHERHPDPDAHWAGGECRLRRGHEGPHVNGAGDEWETRDGD